MQSGRGNDLASNNHVKILRRPTPPPLSILSSPDPAAAIGTYLSLVFAMFVPLQLFTSCLIHGAKMIPLTNEPSRPIAHLTPAPFQFPVSSVRSIDRSVLYLKLEHQSVVGRGRV